MSALLWSCFLFSVHSVIKMFSGSCPLCYKAVFCFMPSVMKLFLFHALCYEAFSVSCPLLWSCFLFHVRSVMKLSVSCPLLWSCFLFYALSAVKLFSVVCPLFYDAVFLFRVRSILILFSVSCKPCYEAVTGLYLINHAATQVEYVLMCEKCPVEVLISPKNPSSCTQNGDDTAP